MNSILDTVLIYIIRKYCYIYFHAGKILEGCGVSWSDTHKKQKGWALAPFMTEKVSKGMLNPNHTGGGSNRPPPKVLGA